MKINFNRKNLNIISFLVSLIIFIAIISIIQLFSYYKQNKDYSYIIPNPDLEAIIIDNQVSNQLAQDEIKDISLAKVTNWQIEIEKLNLDANIAEGTSGAVICNNVGHYTNSNISKGIIALKAYNIGERNNYFANLKELQIGEEIKYTVNKNQTTYKVISNKIIECNEELDESNEFTQIINSINNEINVNAEANKTVNNTIQNDILILITYVKDMPNNLRCVVAEK